MSVMNEQVFQEKRGLRIFEKVTVIIVVILMVTGASIFYSYHQIEHLSELMTEIHNHPLRVTRALLSANINIIKIHRSMKDVVLAQNTAEFNEAIDQADRYEKAVYNDLTVAQQWIMGAKGAALVADTLAAFRAWKPIRDEVIALTKAGQITEAYRITRGKGAKHVALLNRKMDALKNYTETKATGLLEYSEQIQERILWDSMLIFIFLVIVSALAGFLLSRTITEAFRKLVTGVSEFSRGNLDHVISLKANDEIGWLADSLNTMASERKKAQENLKLHAEVINAMAEGLLLINERNDTIVYTNPKSEKMFGYEPGAMTGLHISKLLSMSTTDLEKMKSEIQSAIRNTGEWHGEIRHLARDGHVFWTYQNISRFHHSKFGQVNIWVLTDISQRKRLERELQEYQVKLEKLVKDRTAELENEIEERKRAEAIIQSSLTEKETLLHEIHHRVKNNMQVISSLLKLQANKTEDQQIKSVLLESQNRVLTMSIVHETLYQSDKLAKINLLTYFEKIVKTNLASFEGKVDNVALNLNSEEIFVGIKQATPLGLVINELVSNSLKHAFPDNSEGVIAINITRSDQGTVEISYSDSGVGIPANLDWRNTNSLGLKLIVNLIEIQIGGSVRMETADGTHFSIRFETK